MSRLFQPAQRRCGWLAFATLAVSGLLAQSTSAAEVSFSARSIYDGAPNALDKLVFYNLPTTGPHAGPVNTYFDLRAIVDPLDGTTETASAFGLIARITGTGQVVFNPPAVGDEENNLTPAKHPTLPRNNSFDILYGTTATQPTNNQEIRVIGLEQVALQNNLVTNNDGLASIPIRIAAGATGTYTLAFDLPATYTGFVKTISASQTQFLTNSAAYPHAGATIEVRQSRKADMNGDSFLDGQDISPFVQALGNRVTYQAARPWLQVNHITDINDDGAVDGQDIQPFIQVLGASGGSPAAVPEPSSVAIGLLGFAGIWAARRRWNRKEKALA